MSWLSRASKRLFRWIRGKRGKLLDVFEALLPSLRIEFTSWLIDRLAPGEVASGLPIAVESLERLVESWADDLVAEALRELERLRAKLK